MKIKVKTMQDNWMNIKNIQKIKKITQPYTGRYIIKYKQNLQGGKKMNSSVVCKEFKI